jgi:hypothetical protein
MKFLRALAALVVLMLLPRVAFADATPVQLILTYLPNVSNTDTPEASGIAELVLLEGEVRVSATGLPHLDQERYVAWLVNSQSNATFRLGDFNANGEDLVRFEKVLPDAIPERQWNLLLITVEQNADAARPSNTHSIAGTFPRSQSDPPPAMLPNTGGLPDDDLPLVQPDRSNWLPFAGLAALVAAATGSAGYALGKRHRD